MNVRSAVALGALALCLSCSSFAVTSPTDVSPRRFGQPQVPPQILGRTPLSRLAPESRMGATVVLEMRNRDALDRLIMDQATPGSPDYLTYISPEEFGNRFGASPADYQAVISYLKSQGLTVTATYPNRLHIETQGTASQIEKTFALQMNRYRIGNRDVFANDRTPSLPATLHAQLSSVQGLSNCVQRVHMDAGQPGYTPQAINRMYNIQPIVDSGCNGNSRTIAIASLADYNPHNITYYAGNVMKRAIPPSEIVFDPSHVSTKAVSNGDGTFGAQGYYSEEADLDAEIALSTMPEARIQVWTAATELGFYNIFLLFANQVPVNSCVMSCSWGAGEKALDKATRDAYNGVFAQAASEGLTVFSASGDWGSFAPEGTGQLPDTDLVHPASDPYVVSVGGTTVAPGADDTYGTETGWGYPDSSSPVGFLGSGGGLGYYQRQLWQIGPGVDISPTARRQTPDISLNADPNTGYLINVTGNPTFYLIGGTSASTPLMASATILMQQSIGRSFFLPPLLYRVYANTRGGSPFHDITSGSNYKYTAAPGYDMVTGMGSVDFNKLLPELQKMFYDLNGNGRFDLSDVGTALKVAGGLQKASVTPIVNYAPDKAVHGDANLDGRVTMGDVIKMTRLLYGL